ncbi:hypothetical protein F0T03_17880 [Yersinia canariae]|uniref:Uncharacterized protein n=1 Tax=Yersinia canariae TaxID=2607663 RepID=A0A857F3R8_9GAMM|nr:hypothetical protein [Yersinia canariae]QHB33844.1 hypothetical protein F0T03_17880 [Yersinia canariae]
MKKIEIDVDGESYLIITKNEVTELGIKGKTTPEKDGEDHDIKLPNILIVTRKNADVLFVLRGGETDSLKVLTAQVLYDQYKYQWFEPLADNYRELLYVNKEDYVKDAYKVYSWEDIARFALVNRLSYSYYKNFEGDWKQNPEGGAGYLLVLIDAIPYWADAVGQIPFAVDTYRDTKSIKNTVQIGISWGDGTLTGDADYTNEYDNYFVIRGALYASNKFSYVTKPSGKSYPAAVVTEISHSIDPTILGKPIDKSELEKYGIWNK